jgi:hypothetical protein
MIAAIACLIGVFGGFMLGFVSGRGFLAENARDLDSTHRAPMQPGQGAWMPIRSAEAPSVWLN